MASSQLFLGTPSPGTYGQDQRRCSIQRARVHLMSHVPRDTSFPETTGNAIGTLNMDDYPHLGAPRCMAKSRTFHWEWECQWRLRSFSWKNRLQKVMDKLEDNAQYSEHESIWCRTFLGDMGTCNNIRIQFYMLCISLQKTDKRILGKTVKKTVKLVADEDCRVCAEVPLTGGGYLSFDFNG
ncbi:MAG: hypothetical protein M1834_005999 [Cirrosporium novae-zelandiae]|nr:MAG: hypothetical protein M1834_005999 [Cirrosporium novae-zelandiae]